MGKTIIVIPTYNECENIRILLQKIYRYNAQIEILFVDDNSPDGTSDLIREIMKEDKRVFLLQRNNKEGLAVAYMDGFRHALRMGPDYIIQMDADLSHDPKYIVDFLREINNYDVIIGSRYLKGGGVSDWNWFRLIISRISGFVCRKIAGIAINDPLGGFKCFRAEVLKRLDFTKIKSKGYFFQLEMNYLIVKSGYHYKEVPIVFVARQYGSSKLTAKIAWEAFVSIWKLRTAKEMYV